MSGAAALSREGTVPPSSAATTALGTSSERGLPLLAVAFLLAVLLPVRFWAGPLMLTSVRLVLLAAVIPLTINLLRGRYGRVLPVDWLFMAHLIWMGVSLAMTTPDAMITQMGSVGVEFFGGYLVGRATIRNRRQFTGLVLFVSSAVLLLVPAVLLELRSGHPPVIDFLWRLPGVASDGIVSIDRRMNLERVQAVFSHPIHWGLFCSSMIALLFVGLQGTIPPTRRYLLLGAVIFGTFSSLSSGAILPIVLQIGLIGWAIAFRSVRARWRILTALFAVAWVVVDILSNRSPLMVFLSRATFSAHNAYWRAQIFDWGWKNIFGSAVDGIPSARLFGIGFADWVRPHYMYSGSMDNFWLVVGVRHGVPGFLTLAAGFLWLIWTVARRPFAEDSPLWRLRRAWVIVFFSLSLTLCTVHVWTAVYAYVFFLLGAGAWFLSAQDDGGGEEEMARADEGRRGAVYSRFAGRASAGPEAPLPGREEDIRYARSGNASPERSSDERVEAMHGRTGRPGLHRRSRA